MCFSYPLQNDADLKHLSARLLISQDSFLLLTVNKLSHYTELVHHGLEKFRRDRTAFVNAKTILASVSPRGYGVLNDCAVRDTIEPLVTVSNLYKHYILLLYLIKRFIFLR